MFSCGTSGELRECARCGGIIQPCGICGQYHLVSQGPGGPDAMPRVVSKSWLETNRCPDEEFGEVPVPTARIPPHFEPAFEEFAAYEEILDRPGFYALESFSG